MATKRELLKKIRMGCAECMGGDRMSKGVYPIKNPSEVAGCTAPECGWFEYRFGKDPDKPADYMVERGRKLASFRKQGNEQKDQGSTIDYQPTQVD